MKQEMHNCLIRLSYLWVLATATCIPFVSARAQNALLKSYSNAPATVYLDFDGEYVEGTIWNQHGAINANAAILSPIDILEIFNRVADDYHPFNINITTDPKAYENAPVTQRIRVIFTPTNSWYGNSAGASCIGSFIWGDDTPAWVFCNMLGNNPRFIAACASHQIGHSLGLQHQSEYDTHCGKITEYNGGAGTVDDGWAPIMGVSYYKNCTVWQAGHSAVACDSLQMDAEVIAGPRNRFGFRTDDYGDDHTKASTVNIYDEHFSIKGVMNYARDKDAFKINIDSRKELQLHLVPNNTQGIAGQINIQISVLNANADTIARYDQRKLMFTGVDIMLNPGVYYFIISGESHNHFSKPSFYAMSGSLNDANNIRQFAMNE